MVNLSYNNVSCLSRTRPTHVTKSNIVASASSVAFLPTQPHNTCDQALARCPPFEFIYEGPLVLDGGFSPGVDPQGDQVGPGTP